MFERLRTWYYDQASRYPVRWYFPVIRIFGGPAGEGSRTCYMTRVLLSPAIRTKQLYFHIFHRQDIDRDPHDHPFGYWTWPFQSYVEEVFDLASSCFKEMIVPRWRWSYRPATHTHRVVRTVSGRWPLFTLVLRGAHERDWGFWCHSTEQRRDDPKRFWQFWTLYHIGGEGGDHTLHSNIEGRDDVCPGNGG